MARLITFKSKDGFDNWIYKFMLKFYTAAKIKKLFSQSLYKNTA